MTLSPINRRELLRTGLYSAFGLLAGSRATSPLIAAAPKAKAKSVIQIWMWGGPAHLDTFDPKPDAGNDYCGPLKTPIATNVSGIRISELLPLLAKQADKYSLIRSMTHGVNSHETASYTVQTGRLSGGHEVYPSVGAVVSLFKGYNAGYKGLIPPYIVLTQPQGRFSEAGFLGSRYKPFATGGDPAQARFAVEGVVAPGLTDQRQQERREYLHQLNTLASALPADPQIASAREAEDQAYELILGDAGKVFDLAQEKDDLRDLYGRNTFGQSCLVARRLVERGVPYITINYNGGWDTHKLKVQWEAPWNGGRGHHGQVFSALVAGGGFQGGHVVGASDARGEEVKDRPVHPVDLIGTMYDLLGIDTEAKLPHPLGLPAQVLATPAGRLKEIV